MLHQYYRCSNNESLDELERLSLTHPDRADVHYRLGVEYLRLLQCNKAIGHLGIACKYEPDNLSARLALAAAYDEMGQTEKALENLHIANQISPSIPSVLIAIGYCLEKLSRSNEAAEFYRDAIEQDSSLIVPRQRLAAIALLENNLTEAIEQYEYPCDSGTFVLSSG